MESERRGVVGEEGIEPSATRTRIEYSTDELLPVLLFYFNSIA